MNAGTVPNSDGRATKDYFRSLRTELDASQQEISDLSDGQVDRHFVAHLETRGLPKTARKVLHAARVLHADLNLLCELESIEPIPRRFREPVPYDEFLPRVKAAAGAGDLNRAAGMAFEFLAQAKARESGEDVGRALMAICAIYRLKGAWKAARLYIEEALATPGISARNYARSMLQLAAIQFDLGLCGVAEALVAALTPEQCDADPYLAAKRWEFEAYFQFKKGQFEQAIDCTLNAEHAGADDTDLVVRTRLVRARSLAMLGRHGAARDVACGARQLSHKQPDPGLVIHALIRTGQVRLLAGAFRDAERFLAEARTEASRIGHDQYQAVANLYLCETIRTMEDYPRARRLYRMVVRQCRRVQLTPEEAGALEQLGDALKEHKPCDAS